MAVQSVAVRPRARRNADGFSQGNPLVAPGGSGTITLDANGCAIVYGAGTYRQVLEDSLGDIVWDQLTASTGTPGQFYWANLASGTPNAITVTDPSFAGTDGQIISFIPVSTNTGSATLDPSSFGVYPIVKDTSTGAIALTGGEIVANSPSNIVEVEFSATQQNFHILNLVQASAVASPTQPPQGYLNDVGVGAGGPIQGQSDYTAQTTIYYSPFTGNQIPIWNGSSFTVYTFLELQLALSASAQAASTIYDVCIFNNAGTPTAVFGPAWTDSAAGAGSRGTGAGTAQLTYQSGLLVNAVQITANNGASSYTIPSLQCTYVGSVFIDATAGQVSTYRTWGQSRRWDIWNNYNQQDITLQAGDSTASWLYSTATIRASDGNSANSFTEFTGQALQTINISFSQLGTNNTTVSSSNPSQQIGIGWNSTTVFSGIYGAIPALAQTATIISMQAFYNAPPSIGINTVTALEKGNSSGTGTYEGTSSGMILQATWRG